MTNITALIGLSITAFRNLKVYSLNVLVKLLQYPIKLLLILLVWRAIYQVGGPKLALNVDMSYHQLMCYYILSLLIQQLFAYYQISREVEDDIRQDRMALYLSKPISHWVKPASNLLVSALAYATTTFPISFLIIYLFLNVPFDLIRLLMFLVVLAFAIIIQFLIWYLIGLSAFWTEEAEGLKNIFGRLQDFFNGSLIPLVFMPQFVQGFALALPFHLYIYTPIQVLLGITDKSQFAGILLQAIVWIVLLALLAHLVWSRALKIYNSQGG